MGKTLPHLRPKKRQLGTHPDKRRKRSDENSLICFVSLYSALFTFLAVQSAIFVNHLTLGTSETILSTRHHLFITRFKQLQTSIRYYLLVILISIAYLITTNLPCSSFATSHYFSVSTWYLSDLLSCYYRHRINKINSLIHNSIFHCLSISHYINLCYSLCIFYDYVLTNTSQKTLILASNTLKKYLVLLIIHFINPDLVHVVHVFVFDCELTSLSPLICLWLIKYRRNGGA